MKRILLTVIWFATVLGPISAQEPVIPPLTVIPNPALGTSALSPLPTVPTTQSTQVQAPATPLTKDPSLSAADRLTSLEQRQEALERENAALREMWNQRTFVPGPAAANTMNPATESKSVIERLGTYYKEGFVLVDTLDSQGVPFYLRLNIFNQFRYLNQNLSSSSFTDHLGVKREVDARNDFNVNRNLYYFGGYAFDEKLFFNIIIWSSNSVATVIQGGYIGYEFDKAFKLHAGYYGIPGSRSNTRDFMFLQGVERSMADSFFRPGFTQGVWAEGELFDELNYSIYTGNSLNTLNVNTSKIDKNLVYAGSAWWEPLGKYAPPGAAKTAYSDLEYHESPAVRIGTSFTGAREDRFSSNAANPENVALYNSDGVLTFATGAFAPGVTVNLLNQYMWAQDFGFKHRGFAFNSQYFLRWMNSFKADGPMPLQQTFDHGFEATAGYFVLPKKYEVYGRTSAVFGQFGNSSEYAVGTNWHPWSNRGFRVITELNKVNNSPTNSIQTIYNAGMTGWNFVLQTQLYF